MPTTEEEQGSCLWRETWKTKLYFRVFLDSCGATDFCGFPLIRYFGIWCLTVYLCIFSVYMLWVNMTACFINSLFQRGFNFVLIYYYLRLFIDMVVLLMTKKFLLSFFVSWNQMFLLFYFFFLFFFKATDQNQNAIHENLWVFVWVTCAWLLLRFFHFFMSCHVFLYVNWHV